MTDPREKTPEPEGRPAFPVPLPRPPEEDLRGLRDDPYDPFPEYWPPHPNFVIVIDQDRRWCPDGPPTLREVLETGHNRPPEPDLEAEP